MASSKLDDLTIELECIKVKPHPTNRLRDDWHVRQLDDGTVILYKHEPWQPDDDAAAAEEEHE